MSNIFEKVLLSLVLFCLFLIVYTKNDEYNSIAIRQLESTRNESKIKNYFYYISTDEGILSHYRQLEILWNRANSVGRTIKVVGFKSHHYPGLSSIKLCDIFVLPANITCINETSTEIFSKHNCTYTGFIHPPQHFGFSKSLHTSSSFEYSEIECLAGGLNMAIGKSPPFKRIHLHTYPFFQKKYLSFLPKVRKILGIEKYQEYSVVHWRRGDQLSTRCDNDNKKNRERRYLLEPDRSVNCGSAEVFADELVVLYKKHNLNNEILTYIATNEEDPKALEYLSKKHYKLFSIDLKKHLIEEYPNISPLDIFVIELMLMCDSTYYFAWGESSVHNYVYWCRYLDYGRRHETIIDDPKIEKLQEIKANLSAQKKLRAQNGSSIVKVISDNEKKHNSNIKI